MSCSVPCIFFVDILAILQEVRHFLLFYENFATEMALQRYCNFGSFAKNIRCLCATAY